MRQQYKTTSQTITAGSQFTGAENLGRVDFSGFTDVNVRRVCLNMGSESKSWDIKIKNSEGTETGILSSGSSSSSTNVTITGSIALSEGEYLEVTTSSATAAMDLTVIWEG